MTVAAFGSPVSPGTAMDGLALRSLRPARDDAAPSLPRRVLRHLVIAHGLGLGSRVIVGGDESERVASLFGRVGIDAETAEFAPPTPGRCDAAVWLDLRPAPADERSLLSPASLGRTARLLATVRPDGCFLFVSAIDGPTAGHQPACLERHFETFPGRTGVTVFADRSIAGLFGGGPSGYAVAAWQAPAAAEPTLWRRRAMNPAGAACCAWADAGSPRRAAA